MPDYHFKLMLGTHLTAAELAEAAALLSRAYSRWQTNPNNLAPVETDTSPEVYARTMRKGSHEVILYYEAGSLCGVFVHSLSPQYDQYPLRKLSYLGVFPAEGGYGALQNAFNRYAAFVKEQGEDVIIASDLDQATLNNLLEHAGFREVIDRNEIYFLLSQLLRRQVFSFQKVRGDFVIDQIITLDGKAVRRSKKLLRLQTTPYDFYALYCQQQLKRVQRSIPPRSRAILQEALRAADQGIYFISSFDGTITLENEERGGVNVLRAMAGSAVEQILPEIMDLEQGRIYLLPEAEKELCARGEKIVLRPGFYDFLFFCLKILGSFFVASAAPACQVRGALQRPLAPALPLRYIDLVETICAPEIQMVPGQTRKISDGTVRTAYSLSGPYVEIREGMYQVRKDLMVKTILSHRRDNPAPVIFLCSTMRDAQTVLLLHAEAHRRSMPVLVFDFGTALTRWAGEELLGKEAEPDAYFNIVSVRDFYQIPTMLELLGLKIEASIDLNVAG